MKKISYEALSLVVDQMYSREFPEDADEEIEEWCEHIAEVIKSSGWDETEYYDEFISRELQASFPEDFPNIKEQN